jgi:hypothetical protein
MVDRGITLAVVKPELAISYFTTALRLDPRYARAAFERARLLNGPRYGVNFHRVFKDPGKISIVRVQATALVDLDFAILLVLLCLAHSRRNYFPRSYLRLLRISEYPDRAVVGTMT